MGRSVAGPATTAAAAADRDADGHAERHQSDDDQAAEQRGTAQDPGPETAAGLVEPDSPRRALDQGTRERGAAAPHEVTPETLAPSAHHGDPQPLNPAL